MKRVFLLFISLLITSCSSVNVYIDSIDDAEMNTENLVVLPIDEKILAVKQVHGFPSGGFVWGFVAEDPSVVEISYEKDGSDTDLSYLTGLQSGTTTIYIINRYSMKHPAVPLSMYSADMIKQTKRYSAAITVNVVTPSP